MRPSFEFSEIASSRSKMLTAFAAMQELLKKLFESNGGSKGSKFAAFRSAHLMDFWRTSDGFLVNI